MTYSVQNGVLDGLKEFVVVICVWNVLVLLCSIIN